MTAGGKATVWIIGSNEGGDYTLNAYDGETGALLYQVCSISFLFMHLPLPRVRLPRTF